MTDEKKPPEGAAQSDEVKAKVFTWAGRPLPLARAMWRHNYRSALLKMENALGDAVSEAGRIDVSAGVEQELCAMRERVRVLILAAG